MPPPLSYLFRRIIEVDDATLKAAIRRATVSLKFVPVFMGSAYKNKVLTALSMTMDIVALYDIGIRLVLGRFILKS